MKGAIGDITGIKLMSDKNLPEDRYLLYPDMLVVSELVAEAISKAKTNEAMKAILLKLKPMGI